VQISNVPDWLFYAVVFGVTGLAWWKGGWAERLISSLQPFLLLVLYLNRVMDGPVRPDSPPSILLWDFASDGLIFAICLFCALRSDRYWTIAAAALGLLILLDDMAFLVLAISQWAYMSANLLWVFGLNFVLVWGVWTSVRDRAAGATKKGPGEGALLGTTWRWGRQAAREAVAKAAIRPRPTKSAGAIRSKKRS
jgi:hypothetical protein